MPVIVVITGEDQAFDWTQNRLNGIDLAADFGVVVVTVQSRTNIFSWLTLRNADAPGNLALHDQKLAFDWIQENIQHFGGDPHHLTLLGHGTSGATNAMLHLAKPNTATYFSSMIFMSGTLYSPYSYQSILMAERSPSIDPSIALIKQLACDSMHSNIVLDCLRQKTVSELLDAYEVNP